jgi:NADH dehydrogenase FAD-containing subunit
VRPDQEEQVMGGRPKVVVAGMGDTGVLVASNLGKRFDVVGIATRPALVSGQELGNRLARPEFWRRNNLTTFDRFRKLDRVHVVHGAITDVDLEGRRVTVEVPDGPPLRLGYDVLVIATGVTNGFWRKDRVESLAEVRDEMDAIGARIDAAGSIGVVGGGATGVSAAANLARRHPDKAVHLFYGQDEPLPGYHPKVRRHLTKELTAAGVHLHPGHRAAVPDGFALDELTPGPISFSTGQEPAEVDLVLWAIGAVKPNTAFLPDEILDEQGFVRVDAELHVAGHPEVFAVGDVAATDPHRSSARNWAYRLVVNNVKALVAGTPEKAKPYVAPEHRWGSIIGPQEDGMTVYQPNGKWFRVPRWAVQPILIDVITKGVIYGGIRRSRR